MRYCNTIYNNSGINYMWILKNSTDLLDSLKNGSVTEHKCITSWDFSTLYTTIDHKDLKEKIISLIKKTWDNKFGKHLNISERKAFFSEKQQKGYSIFDRNTFIEIFKFLIDNIYIIFGDCF